MLTYLTAGESHGKGLVAILEGVPYGIKIDEDYINNELYLRQCGYGRGGRMSIEKDKVKILSGTRRSKTIGSPIAIFIENKDASIEKLPSITNARPGHADLAGALKYETYEIRDILERASARETASRVAVGAICQMILDKFDIKLLSHVVAIGGIEADTRGLSFEKIKEISLKSDLFCVDKKASFRMRELIDQTKSEGDTLGGVFEVRAKNIPVGLGAYSQWSRRLEARLSYAVMSIPAIKGVEIGLGFTSAKLSGREIHDSVAYSKNGFKRSVNNAGGIEGGIANGEEIILKAAMKPIATLKNPLKSVDIKSKKTVYAATERSDVCAVPAASVVGKNVAAIEILNAFLEKFGSDSLGEIERNYAGYKKALKKF